MYWVDYGGQSVEGFDYIGVDDCLLSLAEYPNVEEAVAEIRRLCGQLTDIRLYRMGQEQEENADV